MPKKKPAPFRIPKHLVSFEEKELWLLKRYDLERELDDIRWRLLSFHIACDFIPGFLPTPPRKRGRTKTWTAERYDMLIAAVHAVQSEKRGRTIARSIELLQERDSRWRSANEPRYYEAVRDREFRDYERLHPTDYAGLLIKRFRLS
jgi:hypothetical protein